MWDVGRFAEQMRYDAIVVENVVEATRWSGWHHWLGWITDLGYSHRVLSHNSMHHGVAQSRDRIYVVFWRQGLRPDLELELAAWCRRCDATRTVRQGWKNGRRLGRYRQQWVWVCTTCGTTCEPATAPAAEIIDWDLPCPRIGDRRTKKGKPKLLADATRARILAGLQRYGWCEPVTTAGAGHVYEATPGNRARPLTRPLPVQGTTAQTALATPPAVVVAMRRNGRPWPLDGPVPTVAAGGTHHALLMRNNKGGAEMVTPIGEPARTVTTKGHQSLLVRHDGLDTDRLVDDCGFRMLQPHEIAAAMALPDGYIPATLTKKYRTRLAGNAVTPPVMAWITGRVARALHEAAA
jgi:DNA (cytosine-5)-methyltransferase 1